ncbi:MAG: hypothetical protein N2663_06680, partial [Chlorobi bacterium]|nr:hypothetical protein [Chlorobiota bacterium]
MDELTYRDMIDLYLDSMLPSEQRSVLFSALASSEELQADFYHALMIRLAASHYVQQLVPPPAVTARILAATAPPASLLERIRQQLPTKTVRSTLATAAVLSIGFLIGRISTSDIIFPEAERNTTQQARTLPTTSSSPSTAAAPLLPAASPTRTYPASTLPQNRASGVSPVV